MTTEWVIHPLADVTSFLGGGTPAKARTEFWRGDIPWISPKDMKSDVVIDSQDKITSDAIENSATKLIPKGSVLVVVRSGILARAVPIAIAGRDLTINQDLKAILPKKKLDARFLAYFLRASEVNLLDSVTRGATVHRLTTDVLKTLPIPLPPLEEQRRIVAVLDEAFEGLDRARAHAEANLRDSKELFDEAISACFRKIPEHSTHSTLGQLAAFRNGLNFTRTSQGDKVKVVGVGDFKDNFEVPVSEIKNARIDGDLDEHDRLKPGDLLVVRSNGNRQLIGRTMLVPEIDESISFSGFTIRIRLKSDCILPEYLCSYMRTKEARKSLTAGGGGTNISNLNQRLLSSFPIVFPDTDFQLEILERVQIIQSAKIDLFRRYKNALSDFDELRQSILQRAFAGDLT